MRDNDGRKLDHHTLEQMRLRAVDAVESGVHPEDVAASLGMARGTHDRAGPGDTADHRRSRPHSDFSNPTGFQQLKRIG